MTSITHAGKRTILAGAIAGAVLSLLVGVQAPASADAFVPLPSQTLTKTMADGTVVTVQRTDESATITGSLGATPLHRNAFVSGRYNVQLSRPTPSMLIQAGYVVGCQVSVGSLTNSSSGSTSTDSSGSTSVTGASVGETLSIGPGQAKDYFVTDWERQDDFGAQQHLPFAPYLNTDHAKLNYVNTTLSVVGCAGYAQARSFVNVMVYNPNADDIITLYGQPFSLG
ncbi:MspA family porin [Nocardia miyunensis]|uniref:MspA family porin n=1 Tax=Nocardia miyunensis TaxID=282684 RepID=UPI0008334610|nr:MspA family porin [Nocardia miyunensis]